LGRNPLTVRLFLFGTFKPACFAGFFVPPPEHLFNVINVNGNSLYCMYLFFIVIAYHRLIIILPAASNANANTQDVVVNLILNRQMDMVWVYCTRIIMIIIIVITS